MKRWIHASTIYEDNEYVSKTRRNEIKFDHDTIWSIQFYLRSSDLIYQKEVFVLARTFKEAFDQAMVLCNCFDYPENACVVQYAYKDISWWDDFKKDTCGGVTYGY